MRTAISGVENYNVFANASSADEIPAEVLEIHRTGIIPVEVFNRICSGGGDSHAVDECPYRSELIVGANIRDAIRIVRRFWNV